ncbi:MAG: LysM peptidoglycan-binding domain-containing protein [Coprobacillus sp.]
MYNPYMYENERVTYPKVGEIIVYTVNKGDNVYRIAKTFQSEVSWIQVMNNLDKDFMIHPDQQLLIPVLYQQQVQPQPYQRQNYDLYF